MLSYLYSNALTDLLFEKSDDFVGIYDLQEERFIQVNQAGVRMLGFGSEQELLIDPVRSRSLRLPPLADEHRTALVARVRAMGQHEETARIGRLTGLPFWGQLTFNAFASHNQHYALVRIIDREPLHQAEQALDHSVLRYEAIFSYSAICIIVCDQAGRIVSANQLANQLFGYPTEVLLMLPIEQLVPAGISDYQDQVRQSADLQQQVQVLGQNRDMHARRHDGSRFPVEISLSHFRLEDEQYIVAYIADITLKTEAERQLLAHRNHIERLNAELEQKVADRTHALMTTLGQLEQSKEELTRVLAAERELGELKSRFVSMASHEFRTPLTVLQTSATLVEKYAGDGQQANRQKYLDRIRVSVKHLNDILEEFLLVGMVEAGKVEAHPAEIDLVQLMGETVADMQGILKPDQTVQTHLSCPAPVWLDPSLLHKITINLLTNAIKYSGPGSTVTVRGICMENQLTLTVQDQGVGIPVADQEHLFERFFRARNVTNIAGTGLGLHIVGRYVELMGGQVSLHSVLDQGTIVTLELPFLTRVNTSFEG